MLVPGVVKLSNTSKRLAKSERMIFTNKTLPIPFNQTQEVTLPIDCARVER